MLGLSPFLGPFFVLSGHALQAGLRAPSTIHCPSGTRQQQRHQRQHNHRSGVAGPTRELNACEVFKLNVDRDTM